MEHLCSNPHGIRGTLISLFLQQTYLRKLAAFGRRGGNTSEFSGISGHAGNYGGTLFDVAFAKLRFLKSDFPSVDERARRSHQEMKQKTRSAKWHNSFSFSLNSSSSTSKCPAWTDITSGEFYHLSSHSTLHSSSLFPRKNNFLVRQ